MKKVLTIGLFAIISLSAGNFNNRPQKELSAVLIQEIDNQTIHVNKLLVELKQIR